MNNNYKRGIRLMVFYLVCLSQIAVAQATYTITKSQSNVMKLSGTSSLHDWDMNSNIFTGEAQFDFKKDDDQTLIGLTSLSFSLSATSLKSGNKGLDKNAYDALNTDKYKNIAYALLSAKVSPEKDHKFLVKTIGNLSISGFTKEVAIDVYCVVNEDTTINCSGTDTLKMSEFEVEPPSFLLGAMKTGDAITLDFTLVYSKL